jgi:hypothetical protein
MRPAGRIANLLLDTPPCTVKLRVTTSPFSVTDLDKEFAAAFPDLVAVVDAQRSARTDPEVKQVVELVFKSSLAADSFSKQYARKKEGVVVERVEGTREGSYSSVLTVDWSEADGSR